MGARGDRAWAAEGAGVQGQGYVEGPSMGGLMNYPLRPRGGEGKARWKLNPKFPPQSPHHEGLECRTGNVSISSHFCQKQAEDVGSKVPFTCKRSSACGRRLSN